MQIIAQGHTSVHYQPASVWRSLYSNQWTSDHLPRQLSRDFEGMKDSGASIGLPDQWNFHADPRIELTEPRARWLFEVQCLSWAGKRLESLTWAQIRYAKSQWAELFDDGRCYTNGTGTTTHHDYITGVNATADPMLYQLLLLAGNAVDVLGETEMLPEHYFGVQQSYPHRLVRTVDITRPLPAPEAFLEDSAVCHLCTTIKPDGSHSLFPQFEGRARGVLWSAGGRAYVWEKLIARQ